MCSAILRPAKNMHAMKASLSTSSSAAKRHDTFDEICALDHEDALRRLHLDEPANVSQVNRMDARLLQTW